MDQRPQRRNIVKYGQLQAKTRKKGGTLLRKKVIKRFKKLIF